MLFRLLLGPGPSALDEYIEKHPDREHQLIADRLDAHRVNMQRVLDGITARVEA